MNDTTANDSQGHVPDTDESYEGDIAMSEEINGVVNGTLLPQLEILESQVGDRMQGELAALRERAQQAVTSSGESIAALRANNDSVAEAHNEHPEARDDKDYYTE